MIRQLPEHPEPGEVAGRLVVVSPMGTAEEGVFFFKNAFSTLILELRGEKYRYWFSSDVGRFNDYPSYPISGRFTAQGPIIRLQHTDKSLQTEWVFRRVDGEITLWRPSAVSWWHEKRQFDDYGILYRTNLPPERIWMSRDIWK